MIVDKGLVMLVIGALGCGSLLDPYCMIARRLGSYRAFVASRFPLLWLVSDRGRSPLVRAGTPETFEISTVAASKLRRYHPLRLSSLVLFSYLHAVQQGVVVPLEVAVDNGIGVTLSHRAHDLPLAFSDRPVVVAAIRCVNEGKTIIRVDETNLVGSVP